MMSSRPCLTRLVISVIHLQSILKGHFPLSRWTWVSWFPSVFFLHMFQQRTLRQVATVFTSQMSCLSSNQRHATHSIKALKALTWPHPFFIHHRLLTEGYCSIYTALSDATTNCQLLPQPCKLLIRNLTGNALIGIPCTLLFVLSVLWHCWLGIRSSKRPVKNWVMRCWHGYLAGKRCKWFACGPADATATSTTLTSLKSRLAFFSHACLPWLTWKRGR